MDPKPVFVLGAWAATALAIALVATTYLLVTPFSYEWNLALRQPDSDAILAIRFFAALAILCAVTGLGLARRLQPGGSRTIVRIVAALSIALAILRITQTVLL